MEIYGINPMDYLDVNFNCICINNTRFDICKKSNLDFFSLNPKHKRIVAREFIVILICGIILLVGLFVCWAYEKYLKNREEFF